MPHLAEIQKKYKDQVTVLAISDEDLAKVEAFMVKDSIIEGKTWAQAMSYIVATDPDKSVKTEVFSAAGRRGIPSSFIIGKLVRKAPGPATQALLGGAAYQV